MEFGTGSLLLQRSSIPANATFRSHRNDPLEPRCQIRDGKSPSSLDDQFRGVALGPPARRKKPPDAFGAREVSQRHGRWLPLAREANPPQLVKRPRHQRDSFKHARLPAIVQSHEQIDATELFQRQLAKASERRNGEVLKGQGHGILTGPGHTEGPARCRPHPIFVGLTRERQNLTAGDAPLRTPPRNAPGHVGLVLERSQYSSAWGTGGGRSVRYKNRTRPSRSALAPCAGPFEGQRASAWVSARYFAGAFDASFAAASAFLRSGQAAMAALGSMASLPSSTLRTLRSSPITNV
ncbi:hypothetical protein CYFUS_008714 [Cystobacter fuscus]|uniref:Uncharacterized protein n=1 Tax=Cystobacter fuscus TaxID=43 RepID=A0A250JH66_9BACT|nr:hypothetical protein CYFUS_008714 [Cystobacter fuscus]